MKPYTFIANLSESGAALPADSILSCTLFTDDQVKVILFQFAPGQELSEHTASRAAILHFLDGQAHLTLGGDPFEVEAGAWVHMQPNLPHSIRAKTPVTMLLLLLGSG